MDAVWVGLITFVLGFLAAWGLSALLRLLSKRQDDRRKKLAERRRQQRSDTEVNIGRRFANFIDPLLPKDRFWIEDCRIHGIYQVNVGRKGQRSFLTVTIDLSGVEPSPIRIRWIDRNVVWISEADNDSIVRDLQDIKDFLEGNYLSK